MTLFTRRLYRHVMRFAELHELYDRLIFLIKKSIGISGVNELFVAIR